MDVVQPLGEHELLVFLLQFALLLVTARVLGVVASRHGLPSVVGELLAGVMLGPSLLGKVAPGLFDWIFPQRPEQFHLLDIVSWLGVLMLLVLTGLETDVRLIARKGRSAASISLGGIVLPFATGFGLGLLLPTEFLADGGRRVVFALFLGTAMSISAIPVIAKVLMELRIIRRDIGQITLAAGMIDDTIGWILLSIVAGLASSGSVNPLAAGRSVVSVVLVLLVAYTVGRKLVGALLRTLDNHVGGDTVMITALMALALSFGVVTHALRLEPVLGAFVAGILVGQVNRFDHRLRHVFEQVALGVFAPVFFASSGLKVDLGRLVEPKVLLLGLVVLAIAILGKFAGAYVGARASRLGHWEALSLGAGMNARGAMEIIVATIGYNRGILTAEMYSIILMVAVVTSLMAPPILRWTLSHVEPTDEERRRLEAEEQRRESFIGNLKRVLAPVRANGEQAVLAARVLRLMTENEDVEVTSLSLRDDTGRSERKPRTLVQDELDDSRSIARDHGGEPSRTILAEAERGYDLLVIEATERRGNGSGQLFDDLTDEVIQDSPCSLLVLSSPPDDEPGQRAERLSEGRILVPLSGNDVDRYAAEVGFAMAASRNAEVDLVHVVSAPQHALRVGGDEAVRAAVRIGEDIVAKGGAMGEALGVKVNGEVLVADHPEQAIVDRAGRHVDLVVMASGRTPVTTRAFFGHRIDYVISHASCPVAVVDVR